MKSDVVVAGAGPNGLMLACELALAGVRPLVLERLTGPSSEQRANGLVGQIVRMVDRRGLYELLSGTPGPPRPVPRFMFAAFPLNFGELPEYEIVTQAAGRIARTPFLFHYAESGSEISHDGCKRRDDFAAPRVESSHAAEPQAILL